MARVLALALMARRSKKSQDMSSIFRLSIGGPLKWMLAVIAFRKTTVGDLDSLASDAGVDRRTCRRHIAALVAHGLITASRGGGRTTLQVSAQWDAIERGQFVLPEGTNCPPRGDKLSSQRGQIVLPHKLRVSSEMHRECGISHEDNTNVQRNVQPYEGEGGGGVEINEFDSKEEDSGNASNRASIIDAERATVDNERAIGVTSCQIVLHEWNLVDGVTRCARLTPPRTDGIKRLLSSGVDWRLAMSKVSEIVANGHEATLDWFLRPKTAANLLDGVDRRQSARGPASEIVEAWNAIPGVIRCHHIHSKRKTTIAARLAESWWSSNWRAAIEKIKNIAWLKGANDRGWVADLDWFLRPSTVVQIMEGARDDRESNRRFGRLPFAVDSVMERAYRERLPDGHVGPGHICEDGTVI